MDIEALRKQIDEMDSKLLELLNQRAGIAIEIGKLKSTGTVEYYAPEREKRIYKKLSALNTGPLKDRAVQAIYREIISASRALERPLNIAYWGPQGTNTHLASIHRFGSSCEHLPVDTIGEIFSSVQKQIADYGVVPVENSTDGVITYTLDTLAQSDLKICSEVLLEISHHLLSNCKDLSEIKKIYSIPTATAQCRAWLRNNLPTAQVVDISTTAAGAKLAAIEPNTAAIANELAAELYGLNRLRERIEDNPFNRTRFLVIGYNEPAPTGHDKTSIVFSVKHEAGALYKALAVFARHAVNMTLIESRPTKQTPWEYVFFIDFQGHMTDSHMVESLEEFQKNCLFLRVLGSYPEAD